MVKTYCAQCKAKRHFGLRYGGGAIFCIYCGYERTDNDWLEDADKETDMAAAKRR